MGFFDIFKRKTKKQNKAVQLSQEDLKWNKMWELWVDGEIESPYKELMEYYSGINNGGHHCHLDNIYNNRDLKEYVKQLKTILYGELKNNIEKAYNAYIENPDEANDDNVEILENCDSIFYKNEELITEILKERANKIEL